MEGKSARAGFSGGNSTDYWELDGSGEHGGLLDSNALTALATHSLRSNVPGRYEFLLVPDALKSSTKIKADAGQNFSGEVASFNDPAHPNAGADDYSATIDWGDGSISIGTISGNGSNFIVNGSHTYGEIGDYTVQITISSDKSSMRANIYSPTHIYDSQFDIVSLGDQGNVEGDSISLQPSVSGNGGPMYYGAFGLPYGLRINPSTGLISGTIAPGAADFGPYDVEIDVSDGNSLVSTSFTWAVGRASGLPSVTVTSSDDQTPDDIAMSDDDRNDTGFTIGRNSGSSNLSVCFQLSGDATLGVDYEVSFGDTTGYIDSISKQGYVVIPAGQAYASVVIHPLDGGSDDDVTVTLQVLTAGNLLGIPITYQSDAVVMPMKATVPKIVGTVNGGGKVQRPAGKKCSA